MNLIKQRIFDLYKVGSLILIITTHNSCIQDISTNSSLKITFILEKKYEIAFKILKTFFSRRGEKELVNIIISIW